MTRDEHEVIDAAKLAQSQIAELHIADPNNSAFEQLGLRDGFEIVRDFVNHGELGCALDHLLYMVHETPIPFPPERVLALHALAVRNGWKNHYARASLATLTEEQRKHVFNVPDDQGGAAPTN